MVELTAGVARGQGVPALQPPHGELLPTFWEQHGWQLIIAGAVALVMVALVVSWLRRAKPVVVEAPELVARRALEQLRGRVEDGELVAEVSRTIKRYVMTTFCFSPEELTTTEFRRELQAHAEIKPELAAATGDFLGRCDQWKFAPAPPTPKLGAVEGALDLVDKMELSRASDFGAKG